MNRKMDASSLRPLFAGSAVDPEPGKACETRFRARTLNSLSRRVEGRARGVRARKVEAAAARTRRRTFFLARCIRERLGRPTAAFSMNPTWNMWFAMLPAPKTTLPDESTFADAVRGAEYSITAGRPRIAHNVAASRRRCAFHTTLQPVEEEEAEGCYDAQSLTMNDPSPRLFIVLELHVDPLREARGASA